MGCEMVDFEEIVQTYHREYVIDVDMYSYVYVTMSSARERDTIRLDSKRCSHVEKFCKKSEDLIDEFKLHEVLDNII